MLQNANPYYYEERTRIDDWRQNAYIVWYVRCEVNAFLLRYADLFHDNGNMYEALYKKARRFLEVCP